MSAESKIVVTRETERDTVEWSAEEKGPKSESIYRSDKAPAESTTAATIEDVGPGQRPWALILMMLTIVLAAGVAIWFRPIPPKPIQKPLVSTFADLVPVHGGVRVDAAPVRVLTRLRVGSAVDTDESGRAKVRLDTGTTVIIDRATRLSIGEKGITLDQGRVFVTGAAGTEIKIGPATTLMSGTTAAFERTQETLKVYASSGDLTVRVGGADHAVHTGETATLEGSSVKVGPERGFDDWTSGMAAPWAAEGTPRRAMGEVWGKAKPGDAGSPLTIRACDVRAQVTGEVARTEVKTTFFNSGASTVVGDFRMALPKGAIVSRFATQRGERISEGHIALSARGSDRAWDANVAVARGDILEWAGDGWLRGTIPNVTPGQTATVVISYVEWLSPIPKEGDSQVVQYRYPMVGEGAPPLIGEFFARVDATDSNPISLAAGMGARIDGNSVEVRKPDFRPTADLVVDIEMPRASAKARAYVTPPPDDGGPSTLLVRTEVPPTLGTGGRDGVTLALVIDTSTSVDPALLDASKAFVEAVVQGLAPEDRVVVLAADEDVRPVGPAIIGSADSARKADIIKALANLSQGGATDIGHGLEMAANKLPSDAPDGMVIYIGDGWPTLGDLTPEAMRARLARRSQGSPRLGAIAVGPSANRLILAALTKDSGPLIEVADTEDAAKASIQLLEQAITPTITGVSLDLGPSVERVYPRTDLSVRVGGTIEFAGLIRGRAPKSVRMSYRDAAGQHTEDREVVSLESPYPDDVRRRFAKLRVESLALSGSGREATTEAALKAGLLTPWTGWVTHDREYTSTPLGARVLDVAVGADLVFNAALATRKAQSGALASPRDMAEMETADVPIGLGMQYGATLILNRAEPIIRRCRDSGGAPRPELAGAVSITFKLDGEGNVSDVKAQGMTDNDEPVNRCIATIIAGLDFPKSLTKDKVDVNYTFRFPPPDKSLKGRACSPTSILPLPLRRGVWRERLDRLGFADTFLDAKRSCELPNWTARRSLLELTLATLEEQGKHSIDVLAVARSLDDAGDGEAALFLRKEALRRAEPEELALVRRTLLANERLPFGEFSKQYDAAKDDRSRLEVVRRFLAFAPHSTRLRIRMLDLLAALADREALTDAVRLVALDPFADATLIAESAHLLNALGVASKDQALQDEARRIYFEIAERGPNDPWARAFLGDRFRNEGWFDDATATYEVLDRLVPDNAGSAIRLALAEAGAKRLDVALRILSRIEKTGGRTADEKTARIATQLAHLLIRNALTNGDVSAEDKKRLTRREADFQALFGSTIVLVQLPGATAPLQLGAERGPEKARESIRVDAELASVGLYSMVLRSANAENTEIHLVTDKIAAPSQPLTARVSILSEKGVVESDIPLATNGDTVRVLWTGSALKTLPPHAPLQRPLH